MTSYRVPMTSIVQDKKHLTPVVVDAPSTLRDVHVAGTWDRAEQWWQLKQTANGAGITINAPATLENCRLENVSTDGVRIWKEAATIVRGLHGVYIRDDAFSNITHAPLTIDDTLIDGCHTMISWRSESQATQRKTFPLHITNSMFYVMPLPNSGSGGNCKEWVLKNPSRANGSFWKQDSMHKPGLVISNTILRADLANHQCVDLWPDGSYTNVTFVWTSSKPYPGKLPAGVKLVRDVSVWDKAKADWLKRHPSVA